MIFAVATNNQKKLKEIQRILDSFGITAKTLKELGIAVEIEENGTTF
ncbi:MAG: non-canonical purine NTP pyrophosphatase, partial [Oscillospiraceae bacterium]|nr:non-canonical purine NTP pyrophosphatase [Oscillospiraceae bacterium]